MKRKSYLAMTAVALVATVWAGCASSPEKRIAKNEQAFASMSAEARAAIREGRVEPGFTPQQVELGKGKPDRVGSRTTARGREEVWTYEKRGSGLGFGLGIGGGSGGLGGGVGVSSGGRTPNVAYVVYFSPDGVVSAVEDFSAR